MADGKFAFLDAKIASTKQMIEKKASASKNKSSEIVTIPSRRQTHNAKVPTNYKGGGHAKSGLSSMEVSSKTKTAYEEYWEKALVQDGLKKKTLIEGALRINPKNYEEAYVPHPDGHSDIFISGMKARNRSFNGDVVAVLLLEDENVNSGVRCGKVVYIVECKHSRCSTGHLRLMHNSIKYAHFSPVDHRVPRILIPLPSCPSDFIKRSQDYTATLFVARIVEWPANSPMPHGCLHKSLGEAGEIEPETEGMLIENGVDDSPFPQEVLDCLPSDLPWSIPEEEFNCRRDLRDECIFTIDPATARDLDDALSIHQISDETFEIGVHIADVSFFVKEGTKLDSAAADRATSVYLVQKVIPMLPRLLCERLCSLNPGEDKLTFSVIWRISRKGEILEEWFGRTVIKSCVKLSYSHAQGMIEEPDRRWDTSELPPICNGVTTEEINRKVLQLNEVAKSLRRQRFLDGALSLGQVKLQFVLDDKSNLPCGFSVYEQKDSNRLVEEFMLLANMAVAHRIHRCHSDRALLRRHESPQTKQLDALVDICSGLGIAIDVSSAGALQSSINVLCGDDFTSHAKSQVLVSLCSKPMQHALYFCTGCLQNEELSRHYALNVPFYTHFTSPIRRYPDVVVHRLLAASLASPVQVSSLSSEEMQKCATHCNDKKLASKSVQERSSSMFFSVFVKECGPIEEKGMVMGVLNKSFDVLVLKLGVIKRIYCDQLQEVSKYDFYVDGKQQILSLHWRNHDETTTVQEIKIFSSLNCLLKADKEPLKWSLLCMHPGRQVASN